MRISDWSSDVCSSDLLQAHEIIRRHAGYRRRLRWHIGERPALHRRDELLWVLRQQNLAIARIATQLLGPDRQLQHRVHRSEEHTSELQSLMRISYAVFCLKKKKKSYNKQITNNQKTNK